MPVRWSLMRVALGCAALSLALSAGGCTRQLYAGSPLPQGEVAVIHVEDTTVLNLDDRYGLARPLGVQKFEVAPGPHRIILAYDKPARTIGLHDIPAHRGEGICVVDFVAVAGRQYRLGSRPLGTDWTMQRWDGKWEGWVRDPALSEGDDIVGRCTSSLDPPPPHSRAAALAARATATPTATARPLAIRPTAVPAARAVPAAPAPAPPAPIAAPVPPRAPAARPQASVTAAPAPASIRLGTWNLPPLAGGERNHAVTAAVVEASFDVVTLTELDGGGGDYRQLIAALGDGWAGMATGSEEARNGEQYAIAYRREAVRPCPGWQSLRRSTVDGLRRQPAYACFEVGGYPGTPAFDFILAAYRAVSAEDAGAIADEVRHLDAALDEMAGQRTGERDIIVAGQFHLEANELALVTSAGVRTEGSGASLNLLGEPSSALRDHILVHDPVATREIETPGSAVDVRGFAATPQDFRRTVSDHLPVVVQIDIPARDDD